MDIFFFLLYCKSKFLTASSVSSGVVVSISDIVSSLSQENKKKIETSTEHVPDIEHVLSEQSKNLILVAKSYRGNYDIQRCQTYVGLQNVGRLNSKMNMLKR